MESAQRLDGVSPATVQHWLPQQEGGGPEDVNDGVKSHGWEPLFPQDSR